MNTPRNVEDLLNQRERQRRWALLLRKSLLFLTFCGYALFVQPQVLPPADECDCAQFTAQERFRAQVRSALKGWVEEVYDQETIPTCYQLLRRCDLCLHHLASGSCWVRGEDGNPHILFSCDSCFHVLAQQQRLFSVAEEEEWLN